MTEPTVYHNLARCVQANTPPYSESTDRTAEAASDTEEDEGRRIGEQPRVEEDDKDDFTCDTLFEEAAQTADSPHSQGAQRCEDGDDDEEVGADELEVASLSDGAVDMGWCSSSPSGPRRHQATLSLRVPFPRSLSSSLIAAAAAAAAVQRQLLPRSRREDSEPSRCPDRVDLR